MPTPDPVAERDASDEAASGVPHFLAGGGDMGARMRALDWSRTPLGDPAGWPQSLKTIVRVMLDSRYAMWMLWGPELTFFCNDAYLPTVGIKRDWVLGARSDKVWEEIWPDIGPRISQVLERGVATWDEGLLLYLERSGFPEETYHTFSYSPVYDDAGRIAGMLCVVTEVTERVLGERGLRVLRDLAARAGGTQSVRQACKELMAVLGDDPHDVPCAALYVLDPDSRRAWLASSCGAIPPALLPDEIDLDDPVAPWPVDEVASTGEQRLVHLAGGPYAITPPSWPDLVTRALVLPVAVQGATAGGAVLVAGVSPRRLLDDGYRRFFDLVAAQFATALGNARAYETERARVDALAALDRAKTQFFSNVSHEFRTPLTLLLGPMEEALGDPTVPAPIRERLTLAHRNSLRLLKLVNSLLDFSRIEAGRVQASYEPTDVAALTRDLASSFRSAIERAGLRYRVECDAPVEPVHVDREMWEKIVLNLLSNAFKFTLAGEIAVRVSTEGRNVVLTVADTGVGVPADEIARLFERFHRVEGTQGRTHEGSGIGLALVHELVKLHGGTIEVTSTLGAGSAFRVRIPRGMDHLPADRIKAARAGASTAIGAQAFVQEALRWIPDGGEQHAALADTASPAEDQRFAATYGARIVLADDNADMRAYVGGLLGPRYAVEAVADGEQALAAVSRERPDLILSDVMMPRLDGLGLLKALRADQQLRDVPVILLSARAGEEARITGFDAGADDYLVKPFSSRELLARVGAMLERARLNAQALEHERRTRDAMRRRTAQFETLLTEAPLGVYLLDADFRIREMNPTAREVFGDIPDLIGRDFDEVIHIVWRQEYADEIVRIFRHTMETGEPYVAPERIEERRDRGVIECYEWQVNRIPLPDGCLGVVCYFRDVSQHVQARRQLEAADRQKDEFLAMLSHELRNPLAPIYNAAELMSRTLPPEPRSAAALGIVKRQVGHLTRLVDDLLDVSRITRGRIELRRRTIELDDVIAQAVETVEPLFREKHHRVSVTSSFEPLYVDGDPARLVQSFANVLTNAAKYTDPGGNVRIESRADGGWALVTIADDGAGIPPELVPRVFELFVQSQRTLDRSQGGLGIGLSVVKRLIEMHGGRVEASSDGVGRGARFDIRVPLIMDAGAHVQAPAAPAVPRRRILIVDDNTDVARSLAMLLELDDHEVDAVQSSQQALARVPVFRPDVVLLDIGLPDLDGYELAPRLRALPGMQHLRVVALTGYGQAEDRRRGQAAGFDAHLVKPVDVATLQRTLVGLAREASADVASNG